MIYAALGDKDKAFEWLEKGYDERSLYQIKTDPLYDPVRSDPRFADLLRRMNLQPCQHRHSCLCVFGFCR